MRKLQNLTATLVVAAAALLLSALLLAACAAPPRMLDGERVWSGRLGRQYSSSSGNSREQVGRSTVCHGCERLMTEAACTDERCPWD